MEVVTCLGLSLQEAELDVDGGRLTPAQMVLALELAPSHLASMLLKAGELPLSQP